MLGDKCMQAYGFEYILGSMQDTEQTTQLNLNIQLNIILYYFVN